MKFEVFLGRDRLFYYRLLAANGQIVLTGGPFTTRGEAKSAVALLADNAGDDARYDRREARDGRHFFIVTGPDGTQLGSSQMYASVSSVGQAIKRVKESAGIAEVVVVAQLPIPSPAAESFLDLDETDIPPDVLADYVRSVKKVLEHVTFREDTRGGQAFARFAAKVGSAGPGVAPTDDEGFDCAGSIGTFGTYGCAGGTAGTVGTAGSFGCGDPDEINLCWGNDDDDEDGGSG